MFPFGLPTEFSGDAGCTVEYSSIALHLSRLQQLLAEKLAALGTN
jgi:hypothetical protein